MKKYIIVLLSVFLFSVATPSITAFAAESDKSFDGEFYKVTQENDKIMILDKETGEQIELNIEDNNNAILTDSYGETQELTRDSEGNVYLDGTMEIESPISKDNVPKENEMMSKAASKWIYFQTTYYNTQTKGNLQSLALGLFSLMPYVGYIGTIVRIIEAARGVGAPVLYVKVKQYHTAGYQFYKYNSFFYTNKAMTKLLRSTSEEKRMW